MGVYVSIGDIVPDRLEEAVAVQLTRDGGEATVDADMVDRVIAEAEAFVDGYVGSYYDLAAVHDQVPGLLTQLAATVVVFRLYRRRPGAIADELRQEYNDAVSTLRDISKGIVSLGVQPHAAPDGQRAIRTGGTTRRLSRNAMEGW